MGYGMLWLATLAAALALGAALLATATRRATVLKQRLTAAACMAGILLPGATLLLAGFASLLGNGIAPLLAWVLALGTGIAATVWRAFRIRGGEPAGRAWSRSWLFSGFAVFAALSAMTFWTLDRAVLDRLHAVRMEAGAMALAATAPRIPDHQNAAPLYQEAFESLDAFKRRSPVGEKQLGEWLGETPTDADLRSEAMAGALAQVAGDLALLRRAAAMPGCHFEHNTGSLYAIMLPELSAFRNAARWMALEGRHAAAHGDAAAAIRNAAAISRMAGHCAQEPFVISGLVAAAMEGISAGLLDAALASGPVQPPNAGPWADLPPVSYRMVLQRALRMEMAAGLEGFCQLADGSLDLRGLTGQTNGPHSLISRVAMPFWRVFFLETDLAFYRHAQQEYVNRLSKPYARQVEQKDRTELPRDAAHVISALMLPALDRIGEPAARADAHRRLARLAVAVAAYRAAEGAYPARLEDLAPKYAERIPLDPFDDRPLRMAAKGKGVVVYSIGPDRKDDGGTAEQKDASPPADLVLRIGTGL